MTCDPETGSTPDLAPVVLAGGDGERFGDRTKATATLDGRPLVERTVEALRRATDAPPVVAVGDPAKRAVVDPVLEGVRYSYDVDWCAGPFAGLAGALDAVRADAVVLCGCDMPLVAPAAVDWLAARHETCGADAVVPVDDGTPQVLHAVYGREAVDRYCRSRPDAPRLRGLLDGLDTVTVPTAAVPETVPLSRSLTNVNTRRELAALRRPGRRVGRRSSP